MLDTSCCRVLLVCYDKPAAETPTLSKPHRPVASRVAYARMPRRDVLLTLIAPLCITALQLRTWRLQPADLSVGDTVVPTLARRWEANADMMAARERMFAAGLYPGVDYQIESREGNVLTVRPIYPLVEKLEQLNKE